MEDRRTAYAYVTLNVTVRTGSWGPDCTLAQATKQSEDSVMGILTLALKQQIQTGQISITGTKHINVTFGVWKDSCPRCGRSDEEKKEPEAAMPTDLPALRKRLAEFMGWTLFHPAWRPDEDIAQAFMVAEKIGGMNLYEIPDFDLMTDVRRYFAGFWATAKAQADTPALAISLAADAWLKGGDAN